MQRPVTPRVLALRTSLFATLALTPAAAQNSVLTSPAQFSSGEVILGFEGYSRGDVVATQYSSSGVEFELEGGGAPFVEVVDTTAREFGPSGDACLQNFDPLAPGGFEDLIVTFSEPTNRLGFEIKNNLNDYLVIEMRCLCDCEVVDTQTFITGFTWQFVGLESAATFDQVEIDVTGTSNGGFRLDNLRFELDTSVIADTDIPEVTINSPEDGVIVSGNSIVVDASIADTTITTVSSSPAAISTCLPPGGGSVSGAIDLVEGENVIAITATDIVGRTGGSAITVFRDSAPPALTVISPSNGVVASTPVTVSFQVDDTSESTVSIDGTQLSVLPPSGVVTCPVNLVEGDNLVTVTATDAAGNTTSVDLFLVLDLSAPIVTIDSPLDLAVFGAGSSSIGMTATIDDLTETSITVLPGNGSTTLPAGGGVISSAINLVEGSNTITVNATDSTGRVGSNSIAVVLDTTGPELSIDSPLENANLRGIIDFDATALDPSPGSGVTHLDFIVDGVLIETVTEAPFEALFDTTTIADGTHTFTVSSTDGAGNTSSVDLLAFVDNTPPTASILNPLVGEIVQGTVSFDAAGSDAGSGVMLISMLVGGTTPSVDGSVELAVPSASATASSQEDTAARLDGTLTFTAIVVDAAGNETVETVAVVVDNLATEMTLVSPVDGAEVWGVIPITASASDSNFTSLELLVNGVSIGTSTTSPFTMDFDTESVRGRDLTITAVSTDISGRVSTSSASVTRVDIKVKMKPHHLHRRAKKKHKNLRVRIQGPVVPQLVPTSEANLYLVVPGASPVPLLPHDDNDNITYTSSGDERMEVRFDRRMLVAAIDSGIAAGTIADKKHVTVTLMAGNSVIGTDRVHIHKR